MSTTTELAAEIEKLMQEWMESYVKRDTAFLERYLSDDYVSTFPDGAVLDKKGEIDSVRSGALAFMEIPSEMKVRIYGETAVITGRSTIKAKVKGQDVSGEYRFTHVWVKRSDRWQVVASQVTRIALSEPDSPEVMVNSGRTPNSGRPRD
jgi:ketosteroid isomerase-like protein